MEWTMVSFVFRWPHEGLIVGFEYYDPTEKENWYTWKLHFAVLTINYEYGFDENPYEE
jgi:hypothetical protein